MLDRIARVIFGIVVASLAIVTLVSLGKLRGVPTFGDWVFFLLVIALWIAIGYSVVFRITKAHVGLPESFFTGRFKAEKDIYECSEPISPPKKEGLGFKLPWVMITQYSREVLTLKISEQRYDVSGAAVNLSGVFTLRVSDLTTYRRAEINLEEAKEMILGEIDELIITELINLSLEDSIAMKAGLGKKIEQLFQEQVTIELPGGLKPKRELWEQPVSNSEHNFGLQFLRAKIEKLDPVASIAAGREAVEVERLAQKKMEQTLNRYTDVKKQLGILFPDVGNEKLLETFKLVEHLSSEEKKTFEVANIAAIASAMEHIFKKR